MTHIICLQQIFAKALLVLITKETLILNNSAEVSIICLLIIQHETQNCDCVYSAVTRGVLCSFNTVLCQYNVEAQANITCT
jgi:hypothetical protein